MRDVGDSGALLLGLDLTVEIVGHALEFGDHCLDLRDLPALLVDLEAFQPEKGLAGLHHSLLRSADPSNGSGKDLGQTRITIAHGHEFFLTLMKEGLEGRVHDYRFMDLVAVRGR